MTQKTATVHVRMSADVKRRAEMILEELGIPRSVAIDMYYRQIIAHNGIPLDLELPARPRARDEMGREEFDAKMARGLRQIESKETRSLDETFDMVEKRLFGEDLRHGHLE